MKALSIRQPWAWLIVNGHKDIETRDWPTRFRGPVLIHASKGMTRAEYEDCRLHAESCGVTIPPLEKLERGGIVGVTTITDCISESSSPWFFGRFGFVLSLSAPLVFKPLKGQLGFFDVDLQDLSTRLASPCTEDHQQ